MWAQVKGVFRIRGELAQKLRSRAQRRANCSPKHKPEFELELRLSLSPPRLGRPVSPGSVASRWDEPVRG